MNFGISPCVSTPVYSIRGFWAIHCPNHPCACGGKKLPVVGLEARRSDVVAGGVGVVLLALVT